MRIEFMRGTLVIMRGGRSETASLESVVVTLMVFEWYYRNRVVL